MDGVPNLSGKHLISQIIKAFSGCFCKCKHLTKKWKSSSHHRIYRRNENGDQREPRDQMSDRTIQLLPPSGGGGAKLRDNSQSSTDWEHGAAVVRILSLLQ